MDVYSDAARLNQIHDYNPGNGGAPGAPSGFFWTIPLPNAVHQHANGTTMSFTSVPVIDAFSVFSTPVAPALLSVTATWTPGASVRLSETTNGATFIFEGNFATVDVNWTGTSQVSLANPTPFTFTTSGPTSTLFGKLGHERNGSFA